MRPAGPPFRARQCKIAVADIRSLAAREALLLLFRRWLLGYGQLFRDEPFTMGLSLPSLTLRVVTVALSTGCPPRSSCAMRSQTCFQTRAFGGWLPAAGIGLSLGG